MNFKSTRNILVDGFFGTMMRTLRDAFVTVKEI